MIGAEDNSASVVASNSPGPGYIAISLTLAVSCVLANVIDIHGLYFVYHSMSSLCSILTMLNLA
jgi:hypothetical protein